MSRFPTDMLAREWPALASGPVAARLREWAAQEPRLRAFESPQALLRFLHARRADLDRKDAILAFLLERAREDELAARVVLAALLPGLKQLAGSLYHVVGEEDELSSLLLATAWQQIRSFPIERRRSRLAANVLFDTRKRIRAELAELRRQTLHPDDRSFPLAPQGASWQGDVDALLARAVAAGAISAEEAELVARTRIDGLSLAAVAAAEGVGYDALRIRRSRAERRLLFFLGHGRVRFEPRKRRLLGARAAGAGLRAVPAEEPPRE